MSNMSSLCPLKPGGKMQSDTIQWNPMYEGQVSWSARLFVVYLVVLLLVSGVRGMRMLWQLCRVRRAEEPNAFWLAWDSCNAAMVSLKNWSALTFLLSFFVCAWNMADTLRGISMQKVTGTAFLAGSAAELFAVFCFGMFVCVVLYGFTFFYEGLLTRHKLRQSVSRQ